ncbi:hypothetical protein KCP73_03895 [Salmonella enterica subsp. enterica]|nr:hypothetical protein KCP73_03895 [Salmonella enterica subsp. enterica]
MLPTKLSEVGTISIISLVTAAVGSMAHRRLCEMCGMFSRNRRHGRLRRICLR